MVRIALCPYPFVCSRESNTGLDHFEKGEALEFTLKIHARGGPATAELCNYVGGGAYKDQNRRTQ